MCTSISDVYEIQKAPLTSDAPQIDLSDNVSKTFHIIFSRLGPYW